MSEPAMSAEKYVKGVLGKDLRILSKAITLIESTHPQDRALAEKVLLALLPQTGQAIRVGISGAPGVGKSTLIEALGKRLLAAGRRLAVLAVDPSSAVRGGSILGDKTRMSELSRSPEALVRPSPAGQSTGGVASRTRETILVSEAAGFDIVLVESVGVGQSEDAVAGMVDFFLLLVSPDGGDELQSIKRGNLELADAVAVTKADGETRAAAERLRTSYHGALSLLHPALEGWTPPALTVSATEDVGVAEIWQAVEQHHALLEASGQRTSRRNAQASAWMWRLVEQGIREQCEKRADLQQLASQVAAQRLMPLAAARQVIASLLGE